MNRYKEDTPFKLNTEVCSRLPPPCGPYVTELGIAYRTQCPASPPFTTKISIWYKKVLVCRTRWSIWKTLQWGGGGPFTKGGKMPSGGQGCAMQLICFLQLCCMVWNIPCCLSSFAALVYAKLLINKCLSRMFYLVYKHPKFCNPVLHILARSICSLLVFVTAWTVGIFLAAWFCLAAFNSKACFIDS